MFLLRSIRPFALIYCICHVSHMAVRVYKDSVFESQVFSLFQMALPKIIRKRKYSRTNVVAPTRAMSMPASQGDSSSAIRRFPGNFNYSTGIYKFKRTAMHTTINISQASFGGVWDFSLSLLPGFTDFTNLFDQYRLKKVVLKCMPRVSNAQAPSAGTAGAFPMLRDPIIRLSTDNNTTTPPLSADEIREVANNYRRFQMGKSFRYALTPKPNIEIYNGLVTAYSTTGASLWLSSSNTAIPHYGVRYWWDNPDAANFGSYYGGTEIMYEIEATYYLEFRQVK